VSTASWDQWEAAGKTLARRTETAYEASGQDEKANIFKFAPVLVSSRGDATNRQKSAEGIVVSTTGTKAQT
jgi:hypothetical protein